MRTMFQSSPPDSPLMAMTPNSRREIPDATDTDDKRSVIGSALLDNCFAARNLRPASLERVGMPASHAAAMRGVGRYSAREAKCRLALRVS